jgi:hypothetical protein
MSASLLGYRLVHVTPSHRYVDKKLYVQSHITRIRVWTLANVCVFSHLKLVIIKNVLYVAALTCF